MKEDNPHPAACDDDMTQPVDTDDALATPTSSRLKTRGRTHLLDIWNLLPRKKHFLELNTEGQSTGESRCRRECWAEIERRWVIPASKVKPEDQEEWAMQPFGKLRRGAPKTVNRE
nr:hypothetical protein CFP56_23456 [Quercus suber]